MAGPTYYEVLTEAINDMLAHGFDSAERVASWQARLTEAAQRGMRSVEQVAEDLRRALGVKYDRLVERAGMLRVHPGVDRLTYERVRPALRAELDRRLMASMDLIRLHRAESMARQARRFSGWATSLPVGGPAEVDRASVKRNVRKPLTSLPYEDRRVMIDQGHKFVASLHATLATDGGAIAGRWRAVHQPGYNHREAHLERDGAVLLIRGSWAERGGLVVPGPYGYTDEVEQPGELVNCRCGYVYYYALRQLPVVMLTRRGLEALEGARRVVDAG